MQFKHPLAILAIAFSLGIFIASFIRIPFWPIYCLSLCFSILSFILIRRELIFDIAILFAVFFLGATVLKEAQVLPNCHLSKHIHYTDKGEYLIKGFISTPAEFKDNKTRFIFRLEELQINNINRSCCGKVMVDIKGRKDFSYAEALIIKGRIFRPFKGNNLPQRSFRNYLYNKGIFFIMHVNKDSDIVRLSKNRPAAIKRYILQLKSKMEDIIFRHLSFLPATILNAVILGESRQVPVFLKNSMVKSGTVHILVVSGFNVGIVLFTVLLFLKLIRFPRKLRLAMAVPFLVVYCLMTGSSTPVVRATIMAIVFLCADLFKRKATIANSCALAAMLILAVNGQELFDIGFQLSFASVISIIYLYPKIKSFLRLKSFRVRPLRFVLEACAVSFSAWLGTAGFIAYYFRIFSPVTVLANIFIVPLATLITLCGFSLVLISFVLPCLLRPLASTTELLVLFLFRINAFLISLPGAYFYLS